MAVILVSETWFDRDGSFDDEGVREYTRHFNVFTNDINDTAVTVLTAPGIPQLYDQFVNPNDSDLLSCVSKPRAKQDPDNPWLWRVTVEYSTKVLDPARFPEDPLDKPSDVSYDALKFNQILRFDPVTGDAVVNSAGVPFDPPAQVDDTRATLTITRNEATFDPSLPDNYHDTLNEKTFLNVFPPGTVKCDSISARNAWQGGIQYWVVTYKFHVKYEGWVLKLLDAGFQFFNLTTNRLQNIQSDNGTAITAPMRLDGNGQPQWDRTAASVFLSYNGYPTVDFDPLNLP